MKRGQIYYVRSNNREEGSEQKGNRPAVIVSNNKNNDNSTTVEVVYMTTQPKNDLPTHVLIRSALRPSTVLCEQVFTVSTDRIGEWIGELTDEEEKNLNIALAISLGIPFGPGQLDIDALKRMNDLQAQLEKANAELEDMRKQPDYKMLYDGLIEKMLNR